MNKRRAFILLTAALLGGAACQPTTGRPPQTITIGEDYSYPFDARKGDTINLVMNPQGDSTKRCADAGGVITRNSHTNLLICQDVDF